MSTASRKPQTQRFRQLPGLRPVTAIGKVPIVLVVQAGAAPVAVVSTLMCSSLAQNRAKGNPGRGMAKIAIQCREHLDAEVLSKVSEVVRQLGCKYDEPELFVMAPRASAMFDVEAVIAGGSLDAAVFLSALSSLIQLPLRQDTVCSAALAAQSGDLLPVLGLTQKLSAVRASPSIRRFVYCSLDADDSMKQLAPRSRQGALDAFQDASNDVEVVAARDLVDVLCAAVTHDGFVGASLCSRYFDRTTGDQPTGALENAIVRVLTERLEERFRSCLRENLRFGHALPARTLLQQRADYQLHFGRYPRRLGSDLANLVRSLPALVMKRSSLFPLLSPKLCFRLGQLAQAAEERDAITLTVAASGMLPVIDAPWRKQQRTRPRPEDVEAHLQKLISAASAETLAREIGQPIDEVRLSYPVLGVVIDDYALFRSACTSFFVAMCERLEVTPPKELQEDKAEALLAEAFMREGGTDAAWEEARFGVRGGMRFILDRMADTYKHQLQVARVGRVLAQQLKQLNWPDRRALMACLLERLGSHLPPEIRGMDPARLVKHCDQIAWAYISAMDRTVAMFRRY